MSDFALILLFFNFGLFIISFLLILISVLKANKMKGKTIKENKLPKLSKYSYGLGLLALLMMVFASFLLLSQ
jgi:TM2 domain-containing membrane protein YozV